MRHRVLACDYDGTLATDGVCSPATLASLERLVAAGMRLILVTGRTREELESVFDRSSLFAAIVVENGAVVIDADGVETLLAPRLPRSLVDEFDASASRRSSSVACSARPPSPRHRSCLPRSPGSGSTAQVVRNRDSAMVMPPGISKRTGLEAALRSIGGDAEQDGRDRRRRERYRALRRRGRFGGRRQRGRRPQDAVLTSCLTKPNGKGLADLADALITGDLGALTALSPLIG